LPFLTLWRRRRVNRASPGRWGRHMTAPEQDDAYEKARRRVRTRLSLYRHLATYAAVVGAILFIDLVTGGGVSGFVLWFAAIWGAIIVFQAANTFVFPLVWSRETEEKMIQDELRRQQDDS